MELVMWVSSLQFPTNFLACHARKDFTRTRRAKQHASPAHQVNFKTFPVRPSVNFVKYRPTLVAKQETGRVLIVRQGGHPRRGALSVKPVDLGCTAMAVNRAH